MLNGMSDGRLCRSRFFFASENVLYHYDVWMCHMGHHRFWKKAPLIVYEWIDMLC